jgi:hypothetical protein
VRVPQAPEQPAEAVASVDVRRVRVAGHVGVGVVTAVGGDPVDRRTLDRERAEDREGHADRRRRLEALVGEQPVEPDGDAEPGRDVEADEEADVDAADPAPEAPPQGGGQARERQDRDEEHRDPLPLEHPGGDGPDAADGRGLVADGGRVGERHRCLAGTGPRSGTGRADGRGSTDVGASAGQQVTGT